MERAARQTTGESRFPWAILVVVFLLQVSIGAVFTWNQRREADSRIKQNLEANLQVLVTILHDSLQNTQYQGIEPLLTNWVDLYRDKVDYLDLTAANGFVFFKFDRQRPPSPAIDRVVDIPYSYQGNARLTVRWSLAAADNQARRTLVLLGVIELITTLALIIFLRLHMLQRRGSRLLVLRAGELAAANEDLQREMAKRAQTEQALASEKERLQTTLRSLAEGVISIDRAGLVLLANETARKMTGRDGDQCRGQAIDDVLDRLSTESGDPIRMMAPGFLVAVRETPVDLMLPVADGEPRYISLGCSPFVTGDDVPDGWVLVLRDTTGTRRLAQERQKNAMLQALGVLAGGIAHDFNNILMAIAGNLGLAQTIATEGTEMQELLASAEKATDRAADLAQQLLTFAKGGSPILTATAIDEVIREAAEFVTHGVDIHLEFDFAPDLFTVLIDRHQIGQVVQNLVINAREAMPTGGRLKIGCENSTAEQVADGDPLVRLTFSDQGSGIPAADLQHIFDPYYTTKSEGSGLGLAVVHSIITKHGGRLEVRSEVGEGTTFTIYLPASRESLPATAQPTASPILGPGLVLVMDDDPAVRQVTCHMVRQLGFDVIEAAQGDQAVDIYRQHMQDGATIDLVILDLTVPRGMGGRETVGELLKIDPRCRAVVSSGYSNDPVMAGHKDHGFCGALVKPFNIRRLRRVIHQAIAD